MVLRYTIASFKAYAFKLVLLRTTNLNLIKSLPLNINILKLVSRVTINLFLKVREAVKHPEGGGRGLSKFWPNATKS